MRNISENLINKIKNTFYIQFFFFENRVIYEISWKNIAEPDRPQTTLWSMRIACWITKATHSEYVIIIFFHGQNGYANAPQSDVECTLLSFSHYPHT